MLLVSQLHSHTVAQDVDGTATRGRWSEQCAVPSKCSGQVVCLHGALCVAFVAALLSKSRVIDLKCIFDSIHVIRV
jgi:hypothetical protein